MKKIIYSILVISLMIVIFLFSNQEANQSTKVSNGVIDRTVIKIYEFFNKNATESKISEIKEIAVFPIRKLAHLSVYFILGILVLLLMKEFKLTYKDMIIVSTLICMLYACSDEIHQLFVIGRSGEARDVFLDTCGSFLGIVLTTSVIKKITLRKMDE